MRHITNLVLICLAICIVLEIVLLHLHRMESKITVHGHPRANGKDIMHLITLGKTKMIVHAVMISCLVTAILSQVWLCYDAYRYETEPSTAQQPTFNINPESEVELEELDQVYQVTEL